MFHPVRGFRNGHAQTLLGAFLRRQPPRSSRRLWLDSAHGDQLAVDCWGPPCGTPTVVILHGLAGSAQSSQVLSLARVVERELGWQSAGLNMRGAGHAPTIPRLYHGASSDDLTAAIGCLLELGYGPLVLAGFSLGANILLKYLGEQGTALDSRVWGACTVCCPFDLQETALHLERSWLTRRYRAELLRLLRGRALDLLERFPGVLDRGRVERAVTFPDLDSCATAPLHGFASVEQYYRVASARRWLPHVRARTLMLSALDDPFIPQGGWPAKPDWHPELVRAEWSAHGGHLGFVGPGNAFWMEQRIVDFCRELAAGHPEHRRRTPTHAQASGSSFDEQTAAAV